MGILDDTMESRRHALLDASRDNLRWSFHTAFSPGGDGARFRVGEERDLKAHVVGEQEGAPFANHFFQILDTLAVAMVYAGVEVDVAGVGRAEEHLMLQEVPHHEQIALVPAQTAPAFAEVLLSCLVPQPLGYLEFILEVPVERRARYVRLIADYRDGEIFERDVLQCALSCLDNALLAEFPILNSCLVGQGTLLFLAAIIAMRVTKTKERNGGVTVVGRCNAPGAKALSIMASSAAGMFGSVDEGGSSWSFHDVIF